MSLPEFSAEWLALREPVDHRSRADELVPILREEWQRCGWERIVDLGCGTGSNLRYLAPKLPGFQRWILVDHDARLLDRVSIPNQNIRVTKVKGVLSQEGLVFVSEADVVTCAALLDLVDEIWLRKLVSACSLRRCAAYFVLSYDGTMKWSHPDRGNIDANRDDLMIQSTINDHQQRRIATTKALGPTASLVTERLFKEAGYRTWRMSSQWRLGVDDRQLAHQLIDGWERAALEFHGQFDRQKRIREWAKRKRRLLQREFWLQIGHQDLLVMPEIEFR